MSNLLVVSVSNSSGVQPFNMIATIGAIICAIVVIVFTLTDIFSKGVENKPRKGLFGLLYFIVFIFLLVSLFAFQGKTENTSTITYDMSKWLAFLYLAIELFVITTFFTTRKK